MTQEEARDFQDETFRSGIGRRLKSKGYTGILMGYTEDRGDSNSLVMVIMKLDLDITNMKIDDVVPGYYRFMTGDIESAKLWRDQKVAELLDVVE